MSLGEWLPASNFILRTILVLPLSCYQNPSLARIGIYEEGVSSRKAGGEELKAWTSRSLHFQRVVYRHFFPRAFVVFGANELPDTPSVLVESKGPLRRERRLHHFKPRARDGTRVLRRRRRIVLGLRREAKNKEHDRNEVPESVTL